MSSKLATHGFGFYNHSGFSGQGASDAFGLSNAIVTPFEGRRIITSGHIGIRDDETVPKDLREEVEQAFRSVTLTLQAAGLKDDAWEYVYKAKVYVINQDRDNIFEVANELSKRYLKNTQPALAAVVVPCILHPDARVELEVEAYLPSKL
ncbi:hypothetical protein E8E14_004914 [Neopestalotiopsis sp. 37M]|nr:hypothetical protein E8E14_004914 [Neopestalotiopsis sp. 37M]